MRLVVHVAYTNLGLKTPESGFCPAVSV